MHLIDQQLDRGGRHSATRLAERGEVGNNRIIDVAWAVEGEQEALLSDYPAANSIDGVGPDAFGQVPLLAR